MAAIGTTKRSPICFFTRSKHVSQWWDWCKEVASRTPTQQRVNACRCQQTESRFVPKTLTDPHPPLGIAGIWVFPSLCSIGLNFGSKGGYWKLPSMAFPHFSVIFDWTANSVTNRKRLYLGSASGTFPNSASSTLGRENTNPRIISSFYCPMVRQFSVDAVFPHVVWLYLSKQAFDSGRVSSPEPSSPSSSRELIAKQSGEILGTELWGASKALVRPAKSISLFLWHILTNIGNKTRYSPWLQLGMNIISCCKRKDNRHHESGDQEYLFLSQVSLYSRGLDVGWPNCWGQSLGKSWRGAKKTMVVLTIGLNTLDTKIVDFALSVGGGKLKQVIYIYKTTKPLKGSWT